MSQCVFACLHVVNLYHMTEYIMSPILKLLCIAHVHIIIDTI